MLLSDIPPTTLHVVMISLVVYALFVVQLESLKSISKKLFVIVP